MGERIASERSAPVASRKRERERGWPLGVWERERDIQTDRHRQTGAAPPESCSQHFEGERVSLFLCTLSLSLSHRLPHCCSLLYIAPCSLHWLLLLCVRQRTWRWAGWILPCLEFPRHSGAPWEVRVHSSSTQALSLSCAFSDSLSLRGTMLILWPSLWCMFWVLNNYKEEVLFVALPLKSFALSDDLPCPSTNSPGKPVSRETKTR